MQSWKEIVIFIFNFIKSIKPTEDEFLPEDDLKTLKNISHGELIVRS